MSDAKESLAQLSAAFKLAVAVYNENLTKVQDAALYHRAECDKRYGAILIDVKTFLDQSHALMGELEPKIQEFLQSRQARTKTPAKKASRSQKAGRA